MKEKEKLCQLCYNMDWRVPGNKGVCICGRIYKPEVINQETCGVELIRSVAYRDDFSAFSGMKDYFRGILRGNNKSVKGGSG